MSQEDYEINGTVDDDQLSYLNCSENTLSLNEFTNANNISEHQSNQRKQNIKLLEMQLAQLATDEMIDKFESSTQKLLNNLYKKINNELNMFQRHVDKQLSENKLQHEQFKNEILLEINNNNVEKDQKNHSELIIQSLKELDNRLSNLINQNEFLIKSINNNQILQSNSFHNFVIESDGSFKIIDNFSNNDKKFVQQWIESTGNRLLAVCKEHEARTNYWQNLYLETVDNKNENIEVINKTKGIISQCKSMMNRIKEDMKILAEFDDHRNGMNLNRNCNGHKMSNDYDVNNPTNRLFAVEEETFDDQ